MLSPKARLFTALGVLVATCSLAIGYLAYQGMDEFPASFKVERFTELKPGDSYEKVIESLGHPWSYVVVGGSKKLPLHMTNMTELGAYCSTNSYSVILEYSRPRFVASRIFAWEVLVSSNNVSEVRRYFALGD